MSLESHPLDGENMIVQVIHLPTGLTGQAQGVEPSALQLMEEALDDLLKKVEEAGGC